MIKDTQRAKELSDIGKKSPKTGKHGKRKSTLALEAALKERATKIVDSMLIEREEVLDAMKKTRKKAQYHHLSDTLDKLTKNIQLLQGKETGREGVVFKWKNYEPRNTKRT